MATPSSSNGQDNRLTSVGIYMVATNEYLELWKSTAKSIESKAFLSSDELVIYLFTNRSADAVEWAKGNLKRVKLITSEIGAWGWPEATLLRYEFINEFQKYIKADFLMYLDSDMEIYRDFSERLQAVLGNSSIAVVQHPGFARPRGFLYAIEIIKNPRLVRPLIKKIKSRSKGLGSWEENQFSSAYVEPQKRIRYVHGAIWFGWNEDFLKMCEILSMRVRDDLDRNHIAVWHDESHLNWYASNYPVKILDNRFSGFQKYKHLKYWPAYVGTIEKEPNQGRRPTDQGDFD